MARARYQEGFLGIIGKGSLARYFVRFRVYNEDGSSVQKKVIIGKVSEMSKRAALTKKSEVISEATQQVPKALLSNKGDMLFSTFYRERFLIMKTHWSAPQRKGFEYIMDKYVLPKFGENALNTIDKVMVQGYLNTLARKFSKNTIRHIRAELVEVLEEAVDQDFLVKNAAAKTSVPAEARKAFQPILSEAQLYSIIEALKHPKDKAIFCVGTFCAMRTSELFGLPWGNFHYNEETEEAYFMVDQIVWDGERLNQVKTDASEARVHIGPRTLKAILAWKKVCPSSSPNDLIFPSNNSNGRSKAGGVMWAGAWLADHLAPVTKELEIPFRVNFRCTRRTACSLVQEYGHALASAQSFLRHESAVTTASVYTKPVLDSVKVAVNDFESRIFKAKPKKAELKRVK